MCERHSFCLTRAAKIIDGYGITDSHTAIMTMHGLTVEQQDKCNLYEWQPPLNWPDANWADGLTVDEAQFEPKAKATDAMERHLRSRYPDMAAWDAGDRVPGSMHEKTIRLGGKEVTILTHGLRTGVNTGNYLLAGTAEMRCVGGNASVSGVWDHASVSDVGGNASVSDVWDHASVSDVGGNASVSDVWGNASVSGVWGNASVSGVWDHASVSDVWGNASVSDVGGNASVSDVWDHASVSDVGGNASVSDVWGNASVIVPALSSAGVTVEGLSGNAVLIDRRGHPLVVTSAAEIVVALPEVMQHD